MSAPLRDRVGVSPDLEVATVSAPRRSGGSPRFAGRRRFLTVVMATTLATLALAAGGTSAASAATPDPVVRTWGGQAPAVPDELQHADVVAVDGGGPQALALTSDGKVVDWGDRYDYAVPGSLQDKKVIAISAGDSHSLAVTDDGKIVGWGNNDDSKAVLPSYLSRFRFTAVAAGGTHSLGLTTDGVVIPWGGTSYNQTAMPSVLNDKRVTAIAAGFAHNLALTSDGQVAAWGYGFKEGQYAVPALQGQTVVAIAAGDYASVALTSTGRVIGFGPEARYSDVPAAAQSNIIAIAAAGKNVIALTTDHKVVAWEFDDPSTAPPTSVTVPAGVANSRVSLIGAGNGFNLTVGVPSSPSTADDQQLATPYQQPVGVSLTATNEDDSDLTFAVRDQPQHGTLSGTAPNLTYTPSKRYSGTDSFTFTVSDGNFESEPATVSIDVLAAPAGPPVVTPPTKEFAVDTNGLHHSRSITSKTVEVAKDNELLVAFVSVNGPSSKKQSITEVAGGGLSWSLVERGNTGTGTSEVWQAYATQATPAFHVKAGFARSGYSSKITVAGFTDATEAGAATAHASGKSSAPSVTLTPQATNSVVWAAGRVIGERYDPRPGAGTRIVHDVGISHPRVGYWVQKASARTVAGQPVTIADNIATPYRWGLTAVEIHGAVYL